MKMKKKMKKEKNSVWNEILKQNNYSVEEKYAIAIENMEFFNWMLTDFFINNKGVIFFTIAEVIIISAIGIIVR